MKQRREKPLELDMPFGEALHRLVNTSPKELAESVEAEKKAGESIKKDASEERKSGRLEQRD